MELLDQLAAALGDRYRVERELGHGGMAVVFLAEDLKHRRPVAIKVLKPELSAAVGSERFLREIEIAATLQHPHILPLFDSGQVPTGPFLYYVMPFVEGETLRSRLERERQLPVADAVRIAADVADALEYAHRHGAVHRDIKPENILLHDGRPVVADFGIALAVQHAGGTRMTQTGMSLGTPQYMAPEQAMGDKVVDHRVDIYALGAVTYEMLCGEPPFVGPSSQAIVARVMTEKPRPVRSLRDTVPAHIADAVHTALQKLPADRFASAAEFARALQTPEYRPLASAAVEQDRGESGARMSRATLVLGGLALAFAGLAAWGWLRPTADPTPRTAWLLPVPLPDSAAVTSGFSLSDDGATLVYGGGDARHRRIWARRADAPAPVPVEGTDGGINPAISPDGRRIAFRGTGGRILVVPIDGGEPAVVADSVLLAGQPAWLDDEHLVFPNQNGLERAAISGGPREPVTQLAAGEGLHSGASVLPDGAGIVFIVQPEGDGSVLSARVAVTKPGGGHVILMPGALARYAHPGHLLVLRADGALVAVPFDAARRTVGAARRVVSGVAVPGFNRRLAVSRSGRVAFITGASGNFSEVVRVTRTGDVAPVDTGWAEPFTNLAVSQDGRRVAIGVFSPVLEDIRVRDLSTGGLTRITLPGVQLRRPVFSRDGRAIIFAGLAPTHFGIYRARPGSATAPELLLQLVDPPVGPRLSPDDRTLYFGTYRGTTEDIFAHSLDSSGARPRPMVATAAVERLAVPSPDGRWLAYISDESGTMQLYVRSTDFERAERWQVSRSGVPPGVAPRWSRDDGRELFYFSGDSLVAAGMAPGDEFRITSQAVLFSVADYSDIEPLPDGAFLAIRPRPLDTSSWQLMMLEHWNTGGTR